jgi:hypothetical protein
VPTVGRIGCSPTTGWAEANAAAAIGRAERCTGCDPIMTLAGTEVAPARLTKLLLATVLLIVAMSRTWPVLICLR